jgi:hypothetical protein
MSSLRRSLSAVTIYIALHPAVTRTSWRSEVAASFSGQNSSLMAHYTFTELTHTSQNKAADFGIRGLQETGLVSGSRLSC